MSKKKDILQQSDKETARDADREVTKSAAQTNESEESDKESADAAGTPHRIGSCGDGQVPDPRHGEHGSCHRPGRCVRIG